MPGPPGTRTMPRAIENVYHARCSWEPGFCIEADKGSHPPAIIIEIDTSSTFLAFSLSPREATEVAEHLLAAVRALGT